MIPIVILAVVEYFANFNMNADHMFLYPSHLAFADTAHNKIELNRLVLGVHYNNESKAYPIRFLGYHHHLIDTIGGKAILVTYCTVCRTGRVYEPIVNHQATSFRLVGMDHYNAMLEDHMTKSWWRQSTGEAIAGKLKNNVLPDFPFIQSTLKEWLMNHPDTKILQIDSSHLEDYSKDLAYESGTSRKQLTGTDSLSWHRKSWVVGIQPNGVAKAYDWISLKHENIIHDRVGGIPLVIAIQSDTVNFSVFKRNESDTFHLHGDTLIDQKLNKYSMDGKSLNGQSNLLPIQAFQEFWHSWQFFHPGTLK